MTASQKPRQNREGHPCPPWCTTDHGQGPFPGHFWTGHGGDGVSLEVGKHVYVSVRPCHVTSREPEVQVTHSGHGGVFLAPSSAECLAGLLDALADAAPADVRQLAAAVRQAAAGITSTNGAQP
jgi:hypothetical protein